jgi:Ca-activated chloride channel family protein
VLAALACLGLSRLLGFRRRNTSFAAALCVFLLLFSSCSRIQGHLLIMEGNFHNSRHRYTAAIASFLKAQIYGDAAPYAEYGLGLSYSALEEKDAALERYFTAVESLDNAKGEHRELVYRVNYNTGIIRFEQGDYAGAADSFRRALEIDGSRLEAKRNLELSLLALSRPNQSEPDSSPANTGTGEQGSSALFDYLRAKEKEQWKSREWTPDSGPPGPDY